MLPRAFRLPAVLVTLTLAGRVAIACDAGDDLDGRARRDRFVPLAVDRDGCRDDAAGGRAGGVAGDRGRPFGRRFAAGLEHGLFCLGCCWALMLALIAVGVGSMFWMAAVAAAAWIAL
jgi:hypothetical protein